LAESAWRRASGDRRVASFGGRAGILAVARCARMDGEPVDDIVIRAARVEDTEAVAALWLRLVNYHRELDKDLPPATPDGPKRYARSLAERIGDSHTRTFVAEKDGKIVGYVLGVM